MTHSSRSVTWKGTEREERELLAAVERHCACGPPDDPTVLCTAHEILLADQATLDRLVFARRIADRLRREEGLPTEAARRGRRAS
ncbi:MAG TPA: hypothetical protein VGL23_10045 [Chloroflexota bacterium]|jgi:hypothetical protein